MIANIKIGWAQLKHILNDVIIKNLNLQKPIKGDGINISYTATGTIISVAKKGDAGTTKDISGGQWTSVIVVDPVTCVQSTLQVWALPPGS